MIKEKLRSEQTVGAYRNAIYAVLEKYYKMLLSNGCLNRYIVLEMRLGMLLSTFMYFENYLSNS